MHRLIIALAALALPFMAAPALAQPASGDVAACVATTDDAERLACYDRLFRIPSSAASVLLSSEQLIPARPSGRANATVGLVCDAGQPRLEFTFAGHTLSALGSNVGISVKRDARSSRALSLPPSADGTVAVMAERPEIESFVQSLQGVASLSLETRTADYRSLSVRFQVGPRYAELAASLAACR